MIQRLTWRRGDAPRSFAAEVPGGGMAHIQHDEGVVRGCRQFSAWRIEIGGARLSGEADTQQHAADVVNQQLPAALAEAAEMARIDDAEAAFTALLEAHIYDNAKLDIAAFGTEDAPRELLLRMNHRLGEWRRAGYIYLGALERAVAAALVRRRH